MDSRDIQRLDELLQFKRVLLEKEIQMNGMIADNLSKMGEVAHTGKDSMLLRHISEAPMNYKSFRISAYWASSVKYQMGSHKV